MLQCGRPMQSQAVVHFGSRAQKEHVGLAHAGSGNGKVSGTRQRFDPVLGIARVRTGAHVELAQKRPIAPLFGHVVPNAQQATQADQSENDPGQADHQAEEHTECRQRAHGD
uniref:Uncharacterized protein n=1 Tax=Rhipicephalus zambeziensis TaxID=60191 RepID=A0A224YFC8_9ACAR